MNQQTVQMLVLLRENIIYQVSNIYNISFVLPIHFYRQSTRLTGIPKAFFAVTRQSVIYTVLTYNSDSNQNLIRVLKNRNDSFFQF